MHDHQWFACYRQGADPSRMHAAAQVVDCDCGARAVIYPGPAGQSEIRIEYPHPGGSPENALIKDGVSTLGDPQGDRLLLLLNER